MFFVVAAILGVFLATAARLIWQGKVLAGVMVAIGALGFTAPSMLSNAGVRVLLSDPLQHVELPAMYHTSTIIGPNGRRLSATEHLSRIQSYDSAGRFEKGWFVHSAGGLIAIGLTVDGTVGVAAARTRQVELFNLDGSPAGLPKPFKRSSNDLMDGYLQPSEYLVDGVTFDTPIPTSNPGLRWNTLLMFPLWTPVLAWLLVFFGLAIGVGMDLSALSKKRQAST